MRLVGKNVFGELLCREKRNYDEKEEEGDGQLYSSWLIKWLNCSCGDGEWTTAGDCK